jgi:tRNA uridine 5-carbamoylmethylation protein Kti12
VGEVKKLFVMIGIPGSGKSHQSKKIIDAHNNEGIVVINRDKIREMLSVEYSDYDFKQYEKLCINIARFSIMEATRMGLNIIVDETNLNVKSRKRVVSYVKSLDSEYEVIYVWCTESKNNLKYRMENPKGVSEDCWRNVIEKMKQNFEEPDEKEGYNKLVYVHR